MQTTHSLALASITFVASASSAGAQSLLAEGFGTSQFDHAASAVAGIGDIDGDGVGDFIIGSPQQGSGGTAIVYSTATGLPIYSLAGGFGDSLGSSVCGLGDVTGDGTPDFAIGDVQDYSATLFSGSVRVYSGSNGGLVRTIYGNWASGYFGGSIANVGDTNGDGVNDLAVGDRFDGSNGASSGRVSVYSGSTGLQLWTVIGSGVDAELGSSLDGGYDLDSDGTPDVVVGALGDAASGIDSGSAYVLSGASGSQIRVIHGVNSGDHFGESVSLVADIDSDAVADIVIGAPGSNGTSGSVHVYSGGSGLPLHALAGDPINGFLGRSLEDMGDIDGDGLGDFAMSRLNCHYAGDDHGAVVIMSGSSMLPIAWMLGDYEDGHFGRSLSNAGDVDGDGKDDVVVGAPSVSTSLLLVGRYALFAGETPMTASLCHGDGSLVSCPCGNNSAPGAEEGCSHGSGTGAKLIATGSSSVVANDLQLIVIQAQALQTSILLQGASLIASPFKDGLLCAGSPSVRIETVNLDGAGIGRTTSSIATVGGVSPGQTRYYQHWFRDPVTSACGQGSNLSQAIQVDWH